MTDTTVESRLQPRVLVITPAKDESQYVERTLISITHQTVRPFKWIIVDDGSVDATPAIIRRYAQLHDWIVPICIQRDAERRTGSAEILAFYVGLESVSDQPWDYVLKLDADLELPPDYIEKLLEKFHQDSRLGIASGRHRELQHGEWRPIDMPAYHAAGASKMVFRQCFLDIGGFPRLPGWDTADEIKAQTRGWRTGHFPDVEFHHLRPEGRGLGLLRTSALHGKMYYVCGGSGLFFFFKALNRMITGRPLVLSALAMTAGYLIAAIRREPKLVTALETRFYRQLLMRRVAKQLQTLFSPRTAKPALTGTPSR